MRDERGSLLKAFSNSVDKRRTATEEQSEIKKIYEQLKLAPEWNRIQDGKYKKTETRRPCVVSQEGSIYSAQFFKSLR